MEPGCREDLTRGCPVFRVIVGSVDHTGVASVWLMADASAAGRRGATWSSKFAILAGLLALAFTGAAQLGDQTPLFVLHKGASNLPHHLAAEIVAIG